MVMLQKAVRFITTDPLFRNQWTSGSSLEQAVNSRYKLEGVSTTRIAISKAVGKIDPGISNLQVKNSCGIYSGQNAKMRYFFFQDSVMEPPFPPQPGIII